MLLMIPQCYTYIYKGGCFASLWVTQPTANCLKPLWLQMSFTTLLFVSAVAYNSQHVEMQGGVPTLFVMSLIKHITNSVGTPPSIKLASSYRSIHADVSL